MSAVWRASRAAVRRRRLQTTMVVLVSSTALVVALGLLDAASGPFHRIFGLAHSVHLACRARMLDVWHPGSMALLALAGVAIAAPGAMLSARAAVGRPSPASCTPSDGRAAREARHRCGRRSFEQLFGYRLVAERPHVARAARRRSRSQSALRGAAPTCGRAKKTAPGPSGAPCSAAWGPGAGREILR
jgi:hypothetical protein